MASFVMKHRQGVTGQEPAWVPIVGANVGNCLFDFDLAFVQPVSFLTPLDELSGSGVGPLFTNTGLAPTDVITSIEVHIIHEWLDPLTQLPAVYVSVYDPAANDVQTPPWPAISGSFGPGAPVQREDSYTYLVNPVTGSPWTYADLFTPAGFSSDYTAFRISPDGSGLGASTSYRVNKLWIVVNTVVVPIEASATFATTPVVSLAGSGVAVGGAHSVTLDAEPVIESHLGSGLVIDVPTTNRWELQRFAVRPTKQGGR